MWLTQSITAVRLGGEALEKLLGRLKSEEGFSSYGEIVEWLKLECGLELKYNTVNRFVREKLKAKLKVPRPVSAKQKLEAIETFKKTFAWH